MTLQLDPSRFGELRSYLESSGFTFEERPYQVFLARRGRLTVNLFESGKVTFGGSDTALREEVKAHIQGLGAVDVAKEAKEYPPIEVTGTRIGTDEAGKGDYFGPLVIAGTLLTEEHAAVMRSLGVRDSKELSDTTIQNLAVKIKGSLPWQRYEVITISPITYNILHKRIGNVNGILGWGHARAIENLLRCGVPCDVAIADQFGDQSYIIRALMNLGKRIKLIQTPKAEREIAVATASVLARAAFVQKMREMGESYRVTFPKGASHVIEFAREFKDKHGVGALQNVVKLHFKTTEKLDELEVPDVSEEVACRASTDEVPALYEDRDRENVQLECYNLISSFEHELRRFLGKCLQSHFGEDWWAKGIPADIRRRCEKLYEAEKKKGEEVELIDCFDFSHYQLIITDRANWEPIFAKVFGGKDVLVARLTILENLRHRVAHSRGSFEQSDKMDVVATISYFRERMRTAKGDEPGRAASN